MAGLHREEGTRRLATFHTQESISFDVREGGRYRYTMVNKETGQEYPSGSVFLDVIPFKRLVFTWGYPDAPIEDPLS